MTQWHGAESDKSERELAAHEPGDIFRVLLFDTAGTAEAVGTAEASAKVASTRIAGVLSF